MSANRLLTIFVYAYLGLFFAYLFLPLVFMVAAAFNDSRFPTMLPWQGFTWQWFWGFDARGTPVGLFQDVRMGRAIWNSILIGIGVIIVSIPVGLAGALFLQTIKTRAKPFLYGVMVSPILTPGVILGISTLVFWRYSFNVGGGLLLSVIAQSTFIAAYCMLLFMARLERFDRTQEEAALDLGASHGLMLRRVLLPYLRPAILSGAMLAFLQSFENYNTTLFVIGIQDTLTINIASRVRLGLTPAVNAIGVIMITFTIVGAVAYEILRRRDARRIAAQAG